jgi:hypothetical protein
MHCLSGQCTMSSVSTDISSLITYCFSDLTEFASLQRLLNKERTPLCACTAQRLFVPIGFPALSRRQLLVLLQSVVILLTTP